MTFQGREPTFRPLYSWEMPCTPVQAVIWARSIGDIIDAGCPSVQYIITELSSHFMLHGSYTSCRYRHYFNHEWDDLKKLFDRARGV